MPRWAAARKVQRALRLRTRDGQRSRLRRVSASCSGLGMGATQPERMRNVLHTDGAGAV